MTKLFSETSCPDCHYNKDNFACMNSDVACRPSEWERRTRPIVGFTVFKGTTTKKCHKRRAKDEKLNDPTSFSVNIV